MTELKRLLVGVDQSDTSLWAVERAGWLWRTEASAVTLLHVVHRDLQLAPLLEALAEDDAPAILEAAGQVARRVADDVGTPMHVTTASCRGVPFVEIIRRAHEDQAELIVVGRQNRSGFTGGTIGSTAERIVRKAGSAVLVVTTRPSAPYSRPLIASDLSPTSRAAAAFALRLVDPSVTAIDVVHAKKKDQSESDARRAVLACVAAVGNTTVEWNVIIRDGDAQKVILEVADERQSDLLVLGTHGRSAIGQLLIGSVAESVVRTATRDILVIRRSASNS